ncbi:MULTISPECIES: T9SS type A sorting domain-containing protein [unclassified Mucilaginibacter]|uniref:T9SS type A sorting domain-containing protein n=3 Tax=Mucilaginibacter TaxID=423349 RepID=UPI002AC97D3A|nr:MULTISPECIES: T9SS type A sorting domain-containing protein [unclassified Mucilaginibacter]MEB0262352.1 T9SS type A sorting domain-containing protein [Mucilaginibacter sp. 10I4]MEB0279332.1 T9SS type A sorting domain-containing protein [Mucilaginibacter sp. 10B2]WPX23156.1 T9SS type A sorting domain-containing protein [Mucilaginibacter sp. 5C4]
MIYAQEYSDNATYYYNNFETATAGNTASLGAAGVSSATRTSANVTIDASTTSPLEGLVSLASTNLSAVSAIRWDFLGNGTSGINLNSTDYEWNFLYKNTSTSANDDPDVITAGTNSWRYWLIANGFATNGNDIMGFYITHVAGNLILRYRYDALAGTGRYNQILSTPLANDQTAYMIKVQRMKAGTWAIYMDKYVTGMTTAKTLVTISNGTTGSTYSTYYYSYLQATSTTTNRFQWDKFDMYTRVLKFVGTNANSAANGITQPPYSENQTVIFYGLQVQSRGNFPIATQMYLNTSGVALNAYFGQNSGGLYKSFNSFYSTTNDRALSTTVQLGGPGNGAIYASNIADTIASSGQTDGTLSTPQYYFFTGTTSASLNYGSAPTGTITVNGVNDFYERPYNTSTGLSYTNTSATSNPITFGRGYDWKGSSADLVTGLYYWSNNLNWVQGAAPGSSDVARFGVGSNTFTTQPMLTISPTVSKITVGPNTISSINNSTKISLGVLNLTATNGITIEAGGNLQLSGIIGLTKGTLTLGPSSSTVINSTGTLSASSTDINNGGTLTLLSDATGSGSIGALVGSTLTSAAAKTFVQRYVSAVRGVRLFSSPVNTSSTNYSLAYLKNNAWITGTTGTGGGFDKTGNPTIHFFRENMAPSQLSFTSGNFRGVNSFPTPKYAFDGEGSTYDIPVGNGFLFFFRGDRSISTVLGATISSYLPTETIFTATGAINTGSYTVTPWYTPGNAFLGYSTATANTAIRGYNLVGNPYPSTINWEKYNRNGANSSIYGSNNLPATIYIYNTNSKQYAPYQQNTNIISSIADTTTTIKPGNAISSDGVVNNMIASGQGFFIIANNTTQALTFHETAKTSTLPATASIAKIMSLPLKKLMGTPVATTTANDPVFRIKLAKDDINTDAVTFVLNNKNDTKFSFDEDALDIGGNGAKVSLSARSSDNFLLSINRLPLPKLTPQVLPLTVDATATGLYTLKMDALENMPALYQVFLKDAFKADSLDMRAHDTYNFNIDKGNSNTYGEKRFTIVIRQNPALALKLLDFNGVKVTAGVKLNWISENESNYTNFTVERSIDGGKTFDIIGGLHAGNNGTYALVDAKPVKGLNQYRLKQDDINGTISYSKTVNIMYADVEGVTINAFNVYPNPVSNTVNVSVINPAATATTYSIKISDGSGALIKNAVSTQATWQANVGNLLPGTYFVQVINNTTKAVIGNGKFVKL